VREKILLAGGENQTKRHLDDQMLIRGGKRKLMAKLIS
jgi:hypothetical protein